MVEKGGLKGKGRRVEVEVTRGERGTERKRGERMIGKKEKKIDR